MGRPVHSRQCLLVNMTVSLHLMTGAVMGVVEVTRISTFSRSVAKTVFT